MTVVGFRGANARAGRFPAADAVVSTSPAGIRDAVDFDAETYVVVAAHDFVDDRLTAEQLFETDVPYVGLTGLRDRFEEILDDFDSEGRTFSAADPDRLYTPVGLDLGGGSTQQVALSVVSGVPAVENERTPQHLRSRAGTIRDRVEVRSDGGR